MSYYGAGFFGGEFHAYHHEEYVGVSVFFGGEFFDGGYFKALEEVEVKTGGKGDNAKKRRPIYKPTGLTYRKTVEERVEESQAIAAEVVEALEAAPVVTMSLTDIDAEIGTLLRKQMRTEEEEVMLLLLMAVA